MLSFVFRRFFSLWVTLGAASAIVFLLLEVLPGDAALVILGHAAQEDTLAALRAELGLDRPAVQRYLDWISGWISGQSAVSHTYGVPVAGLVAGRMTVTLPLALLALLLATAIAVPLGMYAAVRHNSWRDHGVMGFSQIGMAVPNFWFGILLVLLFSVTLGWLPAGGFPGWHDPGPALAALLLPALSLGLPEAAILARVTRGAVLETLRADYVRTARAKGLGGRTILWRHVLRNALIPMTTIVGLQFAFLLAGSVVVENVFFLPGLGRLIFQAVTRRDLVVVRDVALLLVALVVTVNFVIDVVYAAIDPRPGVAAG